MRNNFVATRPTAVYTQPRSAGPIEDFVTQQPTQSSAPRSHARHLDFATQRAGPDTATLNVGYDRHGSKIHKMRMNL